MSEKIQIYNKKTYCMLTLDPIHIGTGDTNLGRVDNTIVREIGTNLPIIPGSSLMGVNRYYSSMINGTPEAAGNSKKYDKSSKECPIVYTFGKGSDNNTGSAGKVNITDAQIIFFPVYTYKGTYYITCPRQFEKVNGEIDDINQIEGDKAHMKQSEKLQVIDKINLGWIYLRTKEIKINDIEISESIKNEYDHYIKNKLIIVSDKLFSNIVNDNLEVRTSVAIDYESGTADDGALFTYEAIPRGTYLMTEIVEDNFENQFPENQELKWKSPINVVESGLEVMEFLGVGGMRTRGLGRIKLLKKSGEKE